MCGIAGFIDPTLAGDKGRETLRCMADAVVHRGPDQFGTWMEDATGVGMAHRRLSILDLTDAGRQPMISAGGRFVMVFNGEIYNHRDLRSELLRADPSLDFRGRSDTEELLAAIEAWGLEATLGRLNGMFAFALYDRSRRLLHLARDRLGEKPLYFGRIGMALVFGSELKAIRRHPEWRGVLDPVALRGYFRYGYVTGERSIYKGIEKVGPGELVSICIDARDGALTRWRYWSVVDVIRNRLASRIPCSESDATDHLEDLLEDAVAIRMEADVPLGAFLSGGVDSTTVVALMQRRASTPVKTFSIGFGEERFNEAESARAVARYLGTQHCELYVTPRQALEAIPKLSLVYDEPFADASQIPTILVAQLARDSVTVALSGDGGDELFGGYERYSIASRFWKLSRRVPYVLRAALAGSIEVVPVRAWDLLAGWLPAELTQGRPGDRAHKVARRLRWRDFEALYSSLLEVAQSDRSVMLAEPKGVGCDRLDVAALLRDGGMEKMMAWDLVGYLPNDILTKVDRATMAVGLEGRMPLLDHRLVEFAWHLPMSFKRRQGTGKWALKEVLRRLVPSELVERPKRGFSVPIESWLRNELRPWATDLLSARSLSSSGILDEALVQQRLAEHLSGRRNWASQLWAVLMFQAWHAEQSRVVR